MLGSRTDAGILLHSGQRLHVFKHQGIVLEGALDITLHLTYLSDQHYRGYFGYGRRFRYEQHLRPLDGAADTWRLYLHDGREFDFTETADGFLNPGDCPAEVFRQDPDTLVLDYFDDRPRETYQNGNLIRLEDRNGNALRLTHRPDNGLTRIDSNSGTSIDLHYNAHNRVETLEDHSGRRWHYRYDAHDNLIAIIDPLGEPVERYDYREFDRPNEPHNHLLDTVTNADGHAWLAAEYDDQGRVIACREGAERNRYHTVHHQLIEKTDAQGGVTIYSLDAHGLIVAITRPDGRYQREDYDPNTRIAHITDGDHRYEQHYDERHRLLRVDHGLGEREEYGYAGDNPEPVQITKNGQTTTHTYDDCYNRLSTTAPDGRAEHYAWGQRGNLIAHTDGEGHTTAFAYDEHDRVIAVTDPEGHRHQFDYNAQGQPSAHTDPLGHTETFTYDRLGHPTGHTNAMGQTTHVYYTATGRVRELIDPDGERTEWAYNTQGQLTEQRRPGGHRQRYHYNDHGLIDAIQRADGSELHIAYNAQQRITELTAWPDPEAENPTGQRQIYRYNNSGQLIEARNGEHHLQQDYADQGRLTTSTQDGIDLDTWHTADGEHLGGIALLGQSWHYQRDGAGRIEALLHGAHQLQQQHNANGQPVERRYPNGLIEHYTYTDGSQLESIQEAEEKLLPLEYQYNPLGQIERCNDREYHYDPLSQLVQTSERPYHYNASGNPIDNEQSYDAQNRLLSDAQYRYRYDGRGNLIEKQHKETQATTEYVWSLFDQLTEVIHTDADGQIERLCFEYDALGRRVQKSHTQDGETTTHRYLYQGHNLVAILDEKQNLLATILHDQGIDQPLAIITQGHDPKPLTEAQQAGWKNLSEDDQKSLEQQRTERRYYYHRNHQGSITALSDEQGNIVERFEYDAFGNITAHEKTEETFNPFAYTGREFDRPDLYYYRARYYDPTQRRFISPDPIELLSGDFNFYRYVGNDPLNTTDPSGMYPPIIRGFLRICIKPILYIYEKTSTAYHSRKLIDDSNNQKTSQRTTTSGNGALVKGKKQKNEEEKINISLKLKEPNKSSESDIISDSWVGVDDIEVTITNSDGSETFTAKTANGGKVSFSDVKTGVYKITGKQENFGIDVFDKTEEFHKEENEKEIRIKRQLYLLEMYRIDQNILKNSYGHWYVQFYKSQQDARLGARKGNPSESYGWWPVAGAIAGQSGKKTEQIKNTFGGVKGVLNGYNPPSGPHYSNASPTRDPDQGNYARKEYDKRVSSVFFPYVTGGKKAKEYQDCFRNQAQGFSVTVTNTWNWSFGSGWHCQTFQKYIMEKCGLRKSIIFGFSDTWIDDV